MGDSARKVIITGANSGIGKAAAIRFASAGHHVVMACRDLERAARARDEVSRLAGKRGEVELRRLDLASFASIRAFVEDFVRDHDRLDVLIHNAGGSPHGVRSYQRTVDGVETTFATNAIGPLLLTELLLGALERSDDARVLTAGSTNLLHFLDPARAIELDNLRGEKAQSRPYSAYRMYGDSKMALYLLTRRMARTWAGRGIRVNCVMIPAVRMERERLGQFHSWFRLLAPLVQYANPFALPRERMAEVYFQLCTADAFRNLSGALVDHRCRVLQQLPGDRRLAPWSVLRELFATRHAPPYAGNPENVERMWTVAREICGLPPAPAAEDRRDAHPPPAA